MGSFIIIYCFMAVVTGIGVFSAIEESPYGKSIQKSVAASVFWPLFICFVVADGAVEWVKQWQRED